jgi:hypothetical protein
MAHIGIGEHEKESQICIIPKGNELIEKRIHTEPERSQGVTNRAVGNILDAELRFGRRLVHESSAS